ncbi:hypothetical protein H4S08_004067 [Coemansia sp. RSA 1365]|nr:hypothetical protein H4S08_004067 [Coemansia sp. RSA 1365]
MGRVRDSLLSLFRKDAHSAPASTGRGIKRPLVDTPSPHKHSGGASAQCLALASPLPYGDYEAYNSESRQYLNMGVAHIFKTFPSDAIMPLEDEGVGRLKAVYEAWLPKGGSVAKDKVSGIYTLSFANTSKYEGTISCCSSSTTRSIDKHYIQCLYAGTGVRRGGSVVGEAPSAGIEIWIKGSLPVTGPWVQTMYVPPELRLNKLCQIAAPNPDFKSYVNTRDALVMMPNITACHNGPVFEIDSDVYIYICRLSPCASICYTVSSAVSVTREPPMFEFPKIRRAATISTTAPVPEHKSHRHRRRHSPKPCKSRSIFIHVCSDFTKNGITRNGGARLLLPGSVHACNGDAIHLKSVTPAVDINIKNVGYDRAQFLLIDMPGYQDNDDARSL